MDVPGSHLSFYETGAAEMISLQDATGAVRGLQIPAALITYTRQLQAILRRHLLECCIQTRREL